MMLLERQVKGAALKGKQLKGRMFHTETVWRELSPSRRPRRDLEGSDDSVIGKIRRSRRQYDKRRAIGLCSYGGCRANAELGHMYCQTHLGKMSEGSKKRYDKRVKRGLCIYCGLRPSFWGVRCVICRQGFAKHPLPFGARRALRLYREAEKQYEAERIQAEARFAVRKLLASGD